MAENYTEEQETIEEDNSTAQSFIKIAEGVVIIVMLCVAVALIISHVTFSDEAVKPTNLVNGRDYVTLIAKEGPVNPNAPSKEIRFGDDFDLNALPDYSYMDKVYDFGSKNILTYEECKYLADIYYGSIDWLESPIDRYAVYVSNVHKEYTVPAMVRFNKIEIGEDYIEVDAYVETSVDQSVEPTGVVGIIIIPIEDEDIKLKGKFR